MVLRPEKHGEAEAIFRKWGLDFADVGRTTDDLRFRVSRHGDEVADLPIKDLGDQAPEYDRPWAEPKPPAPLDTSSSAADGDLGRRAAEADRLARPLLAPLGLGAIRPPGPGQHPAAAGRRRRRRAASTAATRRSPSPLDVTPRYVEADPFEGGKQAVAECWRNLTAVGATPLAATDNLNFGNPERPEIMGQLVRAIEGIGEACRALDFPIVSGNVSLYNETNGQAILPTPTIGGVGLHRRLAEERDARLQGRGRGDPARRRAAGLGHASRPVALSPRPPRPRGRPAAAGRPRA